MRASIVPPEVAGLADETRVAGRSGTGAGAPFILKEHASFLHFFLGLSLVASLASLSEQHHHHHHRRVVEYNCENPEVDATGLPGNTRTWCD
jgi:hypothetical protein